MVDLNIPRPASMPTPLYTLAVDRIAHMLLQSAVPPDLKKNTPLLNMSRVSLSSHSEYTDHDPYCNVRTFRTLNADHQKAIDDDIDKIILAEANITWKTVVKMKEKKSEDRLKAKELLLVRNNVITIFFYLIKQIYSIM